MLSEVRSKMAIFWHLCPDKILPFMSAPGSDLTVFVQFCPHEVSDIPFGQICPHGGSDIKTREPMRAFRISEHKYSAVVQRLSLVGRWLIFVKRQLKYIVAESDTDCSLGLGPDQ